MSARPDLEGLVDAAREMDLPSFGSVTYLPGAEILREGEQGDTAYLIESGKVQVTKRVGEEDKGVAVLGPGELIGEMAPIDERVRSATATALTRVSVVPVSRRQLEALMDRSDPLLKVILRTLFARLREVQRQLHEPGARQAVWERVVSTDLSYVRALESARDQLKLDQALADALRRREFVLHYQPIVRLSDRSIAGFEALIRWVRPEVGMVSPLEFIEAAERTGLIVPIGLWVLQQAGFILNRLRRSRMAVRGDHGDLFMTVNVSARQLVQESDVDAICSAVETSGVDPSALKLEITENVLLDQGNESLHTMQRLRDLGVSLAVDDFGTGYSSLNYLHRYPVNVLKIDRSFTSEMLVSEASRKLMSSIIALSHGMDMEVVAEGVEAEAELEMLREMGCTFGQGYLFSRPVPLVQAEALLIDG